MYKCKGKLYLQKELTCLPEEIVNKACADCIESLERHKERLFTVERHQESQLAMEEAQCPASVRAASQVLT